MLPCIKTCLVLVFNDTHPVHQSRRQTHHLREGVEGKIFSLHHFLANTISSQDIQHQDMENDIVGLSCTLRHVII